MAALIIGGGQAPPAAADDPPDAVIDDFSTDQATLTLEFPPGGTAESSVTDAGILGGERDIGLQIGSGVNGSITAAVSGGVVGVTVDPQVGGLALLFWDGVDGTATIDPGGLGDVDLTGGGMKDAFALTIDSDDLPILAQLVVFTDAANTSFATVQLPGSVTSDTTLVVPFSSFQTGAGAGADFAHVGAIGLSFAVTPSPAGLGIGFESLTTTSTARATMDDQLVVDVNGNGLADPGDTIEYTTVITNRSSFPDVPEIPDAVSSAVFELAPTAGAGLVVGSVTTTQGTVTTGNTTGDTSVAVDVGTVASLAPVTITYEVVIGPYTGDIANQGILRYNAAGPTPLPTQTETDDPVTAAFSDDTITAVVEPIPTVSIADAGAVVEASSGTTPASFEITLSSPHSQPVAVRATTGDGTATAGADYTAVDQLVTFDPGETSQTLIVDVIGDLDDEADETFTVALTDPDNATIDRASALATITDDDDPAATTTTVPADTTPPTTAAPVVPPTTAPLPPTTAPTLPATGGSSTTIALWALLALGVGASLTIAVRRRRA